MGTASNVSTGQHRALLILYPIPYTRSTGGSTSEGEALELQQPGGTGPDALQHAVVVAQEPAAGSQAADS